MTRSKTIAIVGGICVLAQVIAKRIHRDKRLENIITHFKKLHDTISKPKGAFRYKPTWQGLFDNTLCEYFIDSQKEKYWQVLHKTLCEKLNDAEYAHAQTDEHIRQTWTHMTDSDKNGFYKKINKPLDGRLEQLIEYFKNFFKNNITDTEKEWISLFDNEMSWFYYKRNNGSSWCGILATLGLHRPETCQDVRDIWDLMEDADRDGFFRDTMVLGYTTLRYTKY